VESPPRPISLGTFCPTLASRDAAVRKTSRGRTDLRPGAGPLAQLACKPYWAEFCYRTGGEILPCSRDETNTTCGPRCCWSWRALPLHRCSHRQSWPAKIYHGHLTSSPETANLYATEIDPAFERPKQLGVFYDHTTASPDNVAQMSPCFLEAKPDDEQLEAVARKIAVMAEKDVASVAVVAGNVTP
jgi:hypothetical protein